MKTFKQFLKESSGAPKRRVVSATGVNGSGITTVTYDDGTSETLSSPRPIRNNNPGNLEYGDFARRNGAVGSDGRYAVFPTKEEGWNAKINLLKTNTYQQLSIRDAFNRYAPPSENPNYIRDLQSMTGFDLSRKMSSLNEQEFRKLVDSVATIEGAGEYVGKYSSSGGGTAAAADTDVNAAPGEETERPRQDWGTISGALGAISSVVDTIRSYGKNL